MPAASQPWYERPGPVFAIIAAFFFSAFLLAVAWNTFVYYRALRSGEQSALPQFQSRFTPGRLKAASSPKRLAEVASSEAPSLGSETAKITIVEFADFECPYSREAFPTIRTIAAEYPNLVRLEWRDFPLTEIHSNARPAAVAASCAEKQGKFWPMHDKLFLNQNALQRQDFAAYALEIGLNVEEFLSCYDAGGNRARIEKDIADGERAGVRGTPTFFINGAKVEGAIPYEILKEIIKRFSS